MCMKIFYSIFLFLLSWPSLADYNGSVSFSSVEKDYHAQQIDDFVEIAARCLQNYQTEHLNFYENNCRTVNGKRVCLSKFYGERRYSKKKGAKRPDGKPLVYLKDALIDAGFPTSYFEEMENTSCVGMALDCLKQAFRGTQQNNVWQRVLRFTKDNGVGGTALQEALRELGWKVYYWNPAPEATIIADMKRWDEEEKNWQSKGWHSYRYRRVKSRGTYWYNTVDDSEALVGFGRGEPELLQDIPFWVGTAHTGYHVFPGTYGDVVEAHSTRHITSKDNLEFSRFSPFARGGGPRWTRTEKYRSGLIATPPTL